MIHGYDFDMFRSSSPPFTPSPLPPLPLAPALVPPFGVAHAMLSSTLQRTQEATKQAFVVVQGGSHVGAALPPPPPPRLDLQKKGKDAKVKSETPAR